MISTRITNFNFNTHIQLAPGDSWGHRYEDGRASYKSARECWDMHKTEIVPSSGPWTSTWGKKQKILLNFLK